MIIETITLKNYRQYRDASIQLPIGEDKRFIIIKGENGSGKTNLLNCITWCLFSEETHLSQKDKGYPVISTVRIDELKKDEVGEVSVEISFKEDDGRILLVRREARFRKVGDRNVIPISFDQAKNEKTRLTIFRQNGKDMVLISDPSYVLQKIIPHEINEYFFFDGERLDSYFKSGSRENKIREAVFKISHLELLDRSIMHLERISSEYRIKAKEMSPNLEQIISTISQQEAKLASYKGGLAEATDIRNKAQELESLLVDKLSHFSAGQASEMASRREILLRDVSSLEDKIEEERSERLQGLISNLPGLIAGAALTKARAIIDKSENAGEIPPLYKKEFIETILKRGQCICKTDLTKNNDARCSVESLLSTGSDIGKVAEAAIEIKMSLRYIAESSESHSTNQKKQIERIVEMERELSEKEREIKSLSQKLEGLDIEAIAETEKELRNCRDAKSKASDSIAVLKNKMDECQRHIGNLKEREKQERKKNDDLADLNCQIDFSDAALASAKMIKENIMEEIRDGIEEETQRLFLDFIWKDKTYSQVSIDDNYSISVRDSRGSEAIGTLAAGEREALALAFMAALNKVSGFNVPIVIDTPLGRIGVKPRLMIAEKLPKFLDNKQVIMLVTGTEYTHDVRGRLLPHVSKEYAIDFKELGDGCAEAKVVDYFE
jgi:DNA sulfur modification protein DndD